MDAKISVFVGIPKFMIWKLYGIPNFFIIMASKIPKFDVFLVLPAFVIGQIDHHSKLIVEDVDGEANGGKFLSDTIDIDFKNNAVQIKNGDSGWYEGTYEISQDIRLKKNTDEGPNASD